MPVKHVGRLLEAVNNALPLKLIAIHRKNDVETDVRKTLEDLFVLEDSTYINEIDLSKPIYPQFGIKGPCIPLIAIGGTPHIDTRIAKLETIFNTEIVAQLRHRDNCVLGLANGHSPLRYKFSLHDTADFTADTPAQLAILLNEVLADQIRSPMVFRNYLARRSENTGRLSHASK